MLVPIAIGALITGVFIALGIGAAVRRQSMVGAPVQRTNHPPGVQPPAANPPPAAPPQVNPQVNVNPQGNVQAAAPRRWGRRLFNSFLLLLVLGLAAWLIFATPPWAASAWTWVERQVVDTSSPPTTPTTPGAATPAPAAKPPAPRICTRQQAARGECTRADTPTAPPRPALQQADPVLASPADVKCDKVYRVVTGSTPITGLSNCRVGLLITQGCVDIISSDDGTSTRGCHNPPLKNTPPVREIRPASGSYMIHIIACPRGSTPAPDKFACT